MPMAIPLVVGAAVKAYGDRQASQGASNAAAAGTAQQAVDRQRAMGVVNDQLKYATNTTPQSRENQALDDYMGALREGADASAKSYASVPGANKRYGESVAAASGTANDLAARRANFMSVLRGTQRNRQDIQQHFLDAGTTINGINQDTTDDMRQAGLNIQKAAQVNPAYGIAGSLISNAGSAFAGSGGVKAPSIQDYYGGQYVQPTADQMLQYPGVDLSAARNAPALGSVFGNANY